MYCADKGAKISHLTIKSVVFVTQSDLIRSRLINLHWQWHQHGDWSLNMHAVWNGEVVLAVYAPDIVIQQDWSHI